MKLYLMRHGEAASHSLDDRRPLSDSGKKNVKRIAQFLEKRDVKVHRILQSTKLRTQQTAEIIKNVISPNAAVVTKDYLSPNDPTDLVIKDIENSQEDLMIVGHLPFLPRLISRLTLDDETKSVISMSPGSVVVLEKESKGWKVIWSVSPEIL